MDVQKFQVKLFAEEGAKVDIDALVPIFHGFIREKKLPTLLIDVADYAHVPNGPGVVLIGHEADYYVDFEAGRPGVRYSRKRDAQGDLAARVGDAFKSALVAAELLEREAGLRFGTAEVEVRVMDRLRAPNDDASAAALRPALDAVLAKVFAGAPFTVERVGQPRDVLTLKITRAEGEPVSAVAARA